MPCQLRQESHIDLLQSLGRCTVECFRWHLDHMCLQALGIVDLNRVYMKSMLLQVMFIVLNEIEMQEVTQHETHFVAAIIPHAWAILCICVAAGLN